MHETANFRNASANSDHLIVTYSPRDSHAGHSSIQQKSDAGWFQKKMTDPFLSKKKKYQVTAWATFFQFFSCWNQTSLLLNMYLDPWAIKGPRLFLSFLSFCSLRWDECRRFCLVWWYLWTFTETIYAYFKILFTSQCNRTSRFRVARSCTKLQNWKINLRPPDHIITCIAVYLMTYMGLTAEIIYNFSFSLGDISIFTEVLSERNFKPKQSIK